MVFSSFDFIVLFLPFSVLGYFLAGRYSHRAALIWLTGTSLLFYAWWNVSYLGLLAGAIAFNFAMGAMITGALPLQRGRAKALTVSAIAVNLAVLGIFKYADLAIATTNGALGTQLTLLHIVLPIGISFFTFQAIAYLADCFAGGQNPERPVGFALFLSFFPQLIAGPIVHHREMMPQFGDPKRARLNWDNAAAGLFVFSVGLFKKVIIADSLAPFAAWGFDVSPMLSLPEAWLSVLSYTFQIYFDFSGYTDMAIGAALLFNINLPPNFASPYKSTSIREFWRRWHMTLSRFLRDYLYIPLGGNRRGVGRQVAAIGITFFLGGLWHGAAWTFGIWGSMHGLALVTCLLWPRYGVRLPGPLAWLVTFLFLCMTWIVFRAGSWADAAKVYAGVFNWQDLSLYEGTPVQTAFWLPAALGGLLLLCLAAPNSNQLLSRFKPSAGTLAFTILLAVLSFMKIGGYSEFLYFRF